ADISDSAGAQTILDGIRKRWPWVKHLFADGAYARLQHHHHRHRDRDRDRHRGLRAARPQIPRRPQAPRGDRHRPVDRCAAHPRRRR
ncbi:transposase, partial [Aminobacter sp. BE322]|uniref:transposase n=1 Tax=unclassified Aminobacter TaxID=2644704 RepID=UPI003D24805F